MKFTLIEASRGYSKGWGHAPSKETLTKELLTCNSIKEIAWKYWLDMPLLYYWLKVYGLPYSVKDIVEFRKKQNVDSPFTSGIESKYDFLDKDELTKDLLTIDCLQDIAKKYDIPVKQLRQKLVDFNLPHVNDEIKQFRAEHGNSGRFGNMKKLRVTKDELKQDLLDCNSVSDIGKKYGVTGDSIKYMLKKFDLPASLHEIVQFRTENGISAPFGNLQHKKMV